MRKISLIPVLAAMLLSSCGGDGGYGSKAIKRLDHAISSGSVHADSTMTRGAELLFRISGYGEFNDSSAARYNSMPSVGIHSSAVDSAFNDLSGLERGLGQMLGRAAGELPEVRVGDVFAVISPFNQSVFMADTTLYIGLNHYLGTDYEPYGYFPDYIRKRKIPERIMPDVAEALVRGAYPYMAGGNVLSRLLYEGAVAEAVQRMADVDESAALGYSADEMEWLESNEDEIWKALIERKLLFSFNPGDIRSLVYPGAVTSVLHSESPGGAGRFIGHRIIRSYLENNPRLSADSLLAPGFYSSGNVLKQSRYNP